MRDSDSRVVLNDTSALTRTGGWIITGTHGVTSIEMYKFAQFDARMFGTYRVKLTVVRGSNAAATFEPLFQIAAIKAYALLGVVFGFFALVIALVAAAIMIGLVQWTESYQSRAGLGPRA